MKTLGAHFSRYAGAYFVGALFCLLQVALSLVDKGTSLTDAQQASMTSFDWLIFKAKIAISCLPVIIAFLNQSVSRAAALPGPETPSAPIGFVTKSPSP